MIYIGSVERGPELVDSAAHDAIRRLARLVDGRRSHHVIGDSAALNIVFIIAGSLGRPNFEGVHAEKFSKKKKLLMIQAAIPEKLVSSPKIIPNLCELMRQGVIEAKPVFERAKIPFDAGAFTHFIDELERELGWRK